jgi:hypothetical protein
VAFIIGWHGGSQVACHATSEGRISGFYPPIEGALVVTGLFPIEESVTARQNCLAEHIATRPILELCQGEERLSGSTRRRYWWERVTV